jgi:hypothetical protein
MRILGSSKYLGTASPFAVCKIQKTKDLIVTMCWIIHLGQFGSFGQGKGKFFASSGGGWVQSDVVRGCGMRLC